MPKTCVDSDGSDIYAKGTVTAYNPSNSLSSGTFTDFCSDASNNWYPVDSCSGPNCYQREHVCESASNEMARWAENCPNGCKDGACISSTVTPTPWPITYCKDSDGKNIHVKGEVKSTSSSGEITVKADYCQDSSTVTEYLCLKDAEGGYAVDSPAYQCSAGYVCKDGACVKSYVTPTPSPTIPPLPKIEEFRVEFPPGWNLFSVPLERAKISADCKDAAVWHYNSAGNKFEKVGTLSDGAYLPAKDGYWVKASNSCSVLFQGTSKASMVGYKLLPGWNQIGAPYDSVVWNEVSGDCKVSKGPYSYNELERKYEKTSVLLAGEGYFVKVQNACKLGESDGELPALPE